MKNIAPLSTYSDALDTAGKFVRVMEKSGVTSGQLLLPINSRAARRNLAEYLAAGCPKMGEGSALHLPAEPKPARSLLKEVDRFSSPLIECFVAAAKFRAGFTIGGVAIEHVNLDFEKHLLPKVENNTVAAEGFVLNELLEGLRDLAIITALGGRGRIEISLGQLWYFLELASGAKSSGSRYLACVKDGEGDLWSVHMTRPGVYGLWHIEAFSIKSPVRRPAGTLVVSRP